MSRGSNFEVLSHVADKPTNPDEGNIGAALFKGIDGFHSAAMGGKHFRSTPLTEEEQKHASGKGLDSIKKAPLSATAFADMQAALKNGIPGYSEAGKAAGDAVIDRAISGEHPAAATKRAQDAQASYSASAAARTAEVRPEQHVAAATPHNPHIDQAQSAHPTRHLG